MQKAKLIKGELASNSRSENMLLFSKSTQEIVSHISEQAESRDNLPENLNIEPAEGNNDFNNASDLGPPKKIEKKKSNLILKNS